MITMEKNHLEFRFPETHEEANCRIEFQRTLRIPDDNRDYPLPPGLGQFPLFHVEDHVKKLPDTWSKRGGVFLPMYQSEALWINFSGSYPVAIKVAAGKINAVTGDSWTNELVSDPQDYVIIPDQPWLDGFCVQKGMIRQFVAMPLGEGYSAEEQITGEAEFGGIQIVAYPMKKERWEELRKYRSYEIDDFSLCFSPDDCDDVCPSSPPDMGLAPGGLMRQEIYDDDYGIDAWETDAMSRCFVHIMNSLHFQKVTGQSPPTTSPTAKDYTDAGMPWFEYYGMEEKVLDGSATLAELHSIAAMQVQKGGKVLEDNQAVNPLNVKKLGPSVGSVKDGQW